MDAETKPFSVLLFEAGQLTAAEAELRKLLQFNTPTANESNGLALAGLARIALLREDASRAVLYARESLQHDPGSVDAMLVLAEVSTPEVALAWRREAELHRMEPVFTHAWRALPEASPAGRTTGLRAHLRLVCSKFRHVVLGFGPPACPPE